MKIPFIFSFLILTICACKKEESQFSDSNSVVVNSNKKSKFSVEAERDVESLDSTISVNLEDFVRIRLDMFPSFDQAHSVNIDFNDKKLEFFQITQNKSLYVTNDYLKLSGDLKDDYLYQQMKINESENIHFTLSKNEVQKLVNSLKYLKQSKYKAKIIEVIDGAAFYMSIYEKDTIVLMGTNSPSSHQRNFLYQLFNIIQNRKKDSITIRNIQSLKEYL